MKTFLLAILAALIWAFTFDAGLTAWDAEITAREALDSCLYAGGSPSYCMEVQR